MTTGYAQHTDLAPLKGLHHRALLLKRGHQRAGGVQHLRGQRSRTEGLAVHFRAPFKAAQSAGSPAASWNAQPMLTATAHLPADGLCAVQQLPDLPHHLLLVGGRRAACCARRGCRGRGARLLRRAGPRPAGAHCCIGWGRLGGEAGLQ